MRPSIELPNHKTVYEFYESYNPSQRTSRVLHGAMSRIFKPEVTYVDDAKQKIGEIFETGRGVVIASNHAKAVDPCIIASMPMREPVFAPLLNNTFIPSKESIQAIPVVRHLVDGLGAIPVFREERLNDPSDKAQKSLLSGAARNLMKTSIARLNAGQNMAIFPEGTRNDGDLRTLQELKKGIGLMVCKVSEVQQPAIVPMAIRYQDGARKPLVVVGEPSTEPFVRGREVMEWLPEHMQACVDEAYNIPA